MLSPVKAADIQNLADAQGSPDLQGWRRAHTVPSLAEVFGSIRTRPSGPLWRKLLAFLGPGYLIAVGYMDPGNWATSLAGGSKFGYALLSIALLSNLMAILLQALCVRLGVGLGARPRAGLPRRLPALGRLAALGARRVRDLRHRSRRGDRHGDRPQSACSAFRSRSACC